MNYFLSKNGAKILTRGSESYILLRIMPIISKSSIELENEAPALPQYKDTTEHDSSLKNAFYNILSTVLILSRMLLLNYLDLRLYVCLNQNSVVLTKIGAFWAPFCAVVFSVNLGLS